MGVTLGQDWAVPVPPEREPPQDLLALRLELVLEALEALRDTISTTRPPQIQVEPPDLTAIVDAVNSLKPTAGAEEIAAAVRRALPDSPLPADNSGDFKELLAALRKLDVRLANASAPRMPGGLLSDVRDRTDRILGHVTVDAMPAVAFPATQAVTDNGGSLTVDDGGGSLTVDGTVAVSGTVTTNTGLAQPLTDTQLRAASVPVSGTFWQATQPVSLATNTPDITDRAARLLGRVTVDTMPTTTVTGSGTAGTPAAGVQTVQGITNGTALTVAQQTLTKGTQGSLGVSTQDLKDAGRSAKAMTAAFTSTALTETAVSFQVSTAGGVLSGAATSYTITAGKTLRVQTILAQMRAAGTTPAASLATLKIKVGGVQQGQAFMVACPTTVAAGPSAFTGMLSGLNFPDGFEIAAGGVLTFTLTLSSWTTLTNTPVIDLSLFGFEY